MSGDRTARRALGFTLTELAVALIIVALLLAGALIPLSTQIELRNIADTERTMDTIREALIGFAQANGRLPCPADGSVPSGAANAGAEQWTGTACSTPFGVIPWATLGVPETDSWGRRFSYRVAPIFADAIAQNTWATTAGGPVPPWSPANQNTVCTPAPAPTQSSFALCTLGDMAVLTRSVSATAAAPLGSALAAVFISHGKNGYGAWQPNGTRLTPIPVNDDEASNVNGTTQVTTAVNGIGYAQYAFFSRDPTPAASGCSDPAPGTAGSGAPLCEFDDLVTMISAPVLISRMVAAGRLP